MFDTESATERQALQSLIEVKQTIEMGFEVIDDGWSVESARLFAIDTAMLAVRNGLNRLTELERQVLIRRLTEARRLVVDERDQELGMIQGEFETSLGQARDSASRAVWLVAINAMLSSPYRAAVTTVAAALSPQARSNGDLARVLRSRLRARLGEGTLLRQEPSMLFAIA